MTREDIENNVGYWQEKANLEYIRQRQEHGVNDPYMITEIDEAFGAGYDKGYQYAVDKVCDILNHYCNRTGVHPSRRVDIINHIRKEMQE